MLCRSPTPFIAEHIKDCQNRQKERKIRQSWQPLDSPTCDGSSSPLRFHIQSCRLRQTNYPVLYHLNLTGSVARGGAISAHFRGPHRSQSRTSRQHLGYKLGKRTAWMMSLAFACQLAAVAQAQGLVGPCLSAAARRGVEAGWVLIEPAS